MPQESPNGNGDKSMHVLNERASDFVHLHVHT
jgi:hypothetical protein